LEINFVTLQVQDLVSKLSLTDSVVGLGGCKAHGTTLDCCEYDITIFDNKSKTEVRTIDDTTIQIHRGNLTETDPEILQKYHSMVILSDPAWGLQTLLAKIREKQEKIRNSVAKSALVDAAFFATKAKQSNDEFTAIWIKCAAYLVCDGLVLLNSKPQSPTHMLEFIRKFEKNNKNQYLSDVMEILGLERATPSLLERMVKSTIGFSDMTENNSHSTIIQKKYEYLVANSLLSDCYFYLGYLNKNNIISIRDSVHKRPELIHVLKTAMDLEHDAIKLEQQATLLHKIANDLIHLQNYA
jgi:hypothetical protein